VILTVMVHSHQYAALGMGWAVLVTQCISMQALTHKLCGAGKNFFRVFTGTLVY